MGPAIPVVTSEVLAGAGAGARALVALADLGATYAGWTPVAARPALAAAAGAGLALFVVGAIATVVGRARFVALQNVAGQLRPSWATRAAPVALALVLAASAYVAVLALEVRPRRVWALPTVAMLLAWAALTFGARVRPGAAAFPYVVCGHAAGAVLVEAIVRPSVGPTWVAAAGLGLLVAAWLTWERTRPADRRWPAGIGAIAFILAIGIPALWLVAGLAEPGAGLLAFASSVAGFTLLRSGARGQRTGVSGGRILAENDGPRGARRS
ncbi:MAG: hypothetical protein IPF73_00360 [Betaproteobacteria bacterium]|nr:hypothetical protein [Betaproteobacteria bacterium]